MNDQVDGYEGFESSVQLLRGADGQLWAENGAESLPVRPVRCFPWSAPSRFISLRDAEDEEVILIRDLADLEPESHRALSGSLLEAGFVLEVTRVHAVEEEIEIRTFDVETRQGPRVFQTLRDEWPREMPGGGLLIRDVVGDLYWIPEPRGLDAGSRKELFAFVD